MRTRIVSVLILAVWVGGDQNAVAAGPADPAIGAKLSPAQHQKIAELRLATVRRAAPLRGQLEVKQGELHLLWLAPQPDRKAILRAVAELGALKQKLVEVQVDHDLGMLKLLTPAQRILLAPRGPRPPGSLGGPPPPFPPPPFPPPFAPPAAPGF